MNNIMNSTGKNTKRNAVAYCRVSTQAQAEDDKFGLDVQKQEITAYAEKNNITISNWYVDEGESGAKMDRPEFDKILYGEVQNPPVSAVIVARSDRIARDIELYYYYKMSLRLKEIELISISEDFGKFGVFAEMLESFTLLIAKAEREKITKNTSGGRRVKAARGGYSGGRPPYGYKAYNKTLVIDEEEAETVREILEMHRRGATYRETVAMLKKKGRKNKSGTDFTISSVQVIWNNENFYKGMYKYGKNADGRDADWVQGQHEPILTDSGVTSVATDVPADDIVTD